MTSLPKRTVKAYQSLSPVLTMLLCMLSLTGCKVELYSQLSERRANEMLSALSQSGVVTTKTSMGKGLFKIRVEESDLARSIRILDARGLPGDVFATMGDLYQKEGLISSPMEERVRYMFALSQSIAETLTNIDGVLVARVHVALPESDKYSGDFRPTSASVFIKHHHEYSQDRAIPEIKRIIESSIEGLSYERIAVFMSSAEVVLFKDDNDGSLNLIGGSIGSKIILLITFVSTALIIIFIVGWLAWRRGLLRDSQNGKGFRTLETYYRAACRRMGLKGMDNTLKLKRNDIV